jgi:hypothetical protein
MPAENVTAMQISQFRKALLIKASRDTRAGVSLPLKWLGKAKHLTRFAIS